ncbi:MAG: molybdopterin oxidoreductase, partial [Bdellovibrionales bacterium]|nr:molybdopterin oxidoreductase [Bdellovibrionales bacterium]
AFVVTLITDKERAWHSYLVSFFYFVSLAVGGLFFAAVQHVTKAGWSVNIRRLVESFTAFMPFAFVGAIVLIIGSTHLYEWLHADVVAKDALLQHKAGYLNMPFFAIRVLVFFGAWVLFSRILVGASTKQDSTGDVNLTHKCVPWSVAFLPVFALSYTFFSFDSLMSLEPHWFSTIYGVYTFSGLFQATMAATILLILYLSKKGLLRGYVDENHLHDLGKFLFAFTVFWAYIAFSQYMLIWYANLPEETIFFLPRLDNGWLTVSISLIIFKFIVPFLALLPRWAKRTPTHLAAVSVLILIMQYVDLHWLVYPVYNHDEVKFGLPEIGVFLGFAGLFLFAVARFLSKHSVVAVKDPRISESLHHHVTY